MKFRHLLLYGIETFVIDIVIQFHDVPRSEISILPFCVRGNVTFLVNSFDEIKGKFFVRRLFLIPLIKCGGSNSGMISCPESSILPAENKIVK